MFFPVQQELGALVVLPAVPCPTPGCLQGRGTQLAGHSVRLSVPVEGKGREGKGGAERWPSCPAQTGAELLQSVNSK